MGSSLDISVIVSGLSALYGRDLAAVVETARIADEVGVGQIVMTDHLAIGPRTDRYPYGRFPFPPQEPWPEPLTTLAAMAGATRRIRLGTGVLLVPLRPALLLAKTLATLDVMSGGRLELGVGTGWQREEFEASGVPFIGRTSRLDDTLRACRVLWSEAPACFESDTVRFEDVHCLPQPVQQGGIPIWIGGALSDGNLRRIVEFGAGWMPMGADPELLRQGRARIREALIAAGRTPDSVGLRATVAPVVGADGVDLDRSLEALGPLQDAGATQVAFALAGFVRRPDGIRPFLERLGGLRP